MSGLDTFCFCAHAGMHACMHAFSTCYIIQSWRNGCAAVPSVISRRRALVLRLGSEFRCEVSWDVRIRAWLIH